MITDTNFLDAHFSTGVGQYDANWDKIESEWYMVAENIEKKESPNGGFEIQNITQKSYLLFPNVYYINDKRSITFYVSSLEGAIIEIRANNSKGKVLASCNIPKTGGWNNYQPIKCNLNNTNGVKDVYITFKGSGNDLLHLDWFLFNN
ncbi:carbohydrate-binding protein [Jejuia pallidilutea]|uniref:Endo-1,4-beta-xylanase D n=3 Tax=Jejuia pallidilutea TaxID=504487 RepID=A0A090W6P3_9FLAO|nr:carbohydrate-binding protein [Jejuia pallidilutea]GAL72690.1 endo-1,4-beta-xylanase D precursor [Jejuia pallidilutea]